MLEVTGMEPELAAGIARARSTLDAGKGAKVLDRLRAFAEAL